MKKLDSKLGLFVYALVLTGLILATPLLAGVLNTFNPGEILKSSEVNQNFMLIQDQQDSLQGQLDNQCLQLGKIRASAVMDPGGDLEPEFFSCNGATLTTNRPNTGVYTLVVEGVSDHRDIHVQLTPRSFGSVFCTYSTTADTITIRCWDENGNAISQAFAVTLINGLPN